MINNLTKVSVHLMFALWSCLALGQPVILYTDIVSGPIIGGENNHGIYLSLFGTGFGDDLRHVKVCVNETEVAVYKFLGPSRGREDVQQLTVQPGSSITSGAITIQVDSELSNTDHTFSVGDGNIYFVSLAGNDSTGELNNVARPFRSVQATFDRPEFGPGDTIVIRGGTWQDIGRYDAFLSVYQKTGSADKPITIMAYPGEKTYLETRGKRGGINFYKTNGGLVISGLAINSNGNDLIQMQNRSDNMRVVNNELYGLWKEKGGSAAIVGNGHHWKILGNHVHDNGYSKLFHGIYIDNDNGLGSDDIEIAFNHIHHQAGGRGIQVYWSYPSMTNISIHDNLIHDIDRDAILISDNAGEGIEIFNNVVYRSGTVHGSGIRINSALAYVKAYNNTLYQSDTAKRQGAIYVEDTKQADIYNNIVYTQAREAFFTIDAPADRVRVYNNLWFGERSWFRAPNPPRLDSKPLNGDPLFVDANSQDFRLQRNSPAINAGIPPAPQRDFSGALRPNPISRSSKGEPDLGAFEFVPH
jgi:hypothetical protein